MHPQAAVKFTIENHEIETLEGVYIYMPSEVTDLIIKCSKLKSLKGLENCTIISSL